MFNADRFVLYVCVCMYLHSTVRDLSEVALLRAIFLHRPENACNVFLLAGYKTQVRRESERDVRLDVYALKGGKLFSYK